MKTYDVAIIGAGTAGLSACREVAKLTDNYVVIDHGPLGTTCARVGCMPSKVLIQVANDFERRNVFEKVGIQGGSGLKIDSSQVMNHVRTLRDRFVKSVLADGDAWQGKHLLQKKARFVDPHILDLEGEQIRVGKTIIATGSKPFIPKGWDKYQKYLVDTDFIFEWKTLPRKMAVIGLGAIGIELGQALSRLGVEIVGFDLQKSLGGITDPKILDYVIQQLSTEMRFHFDGADPVSEEAQGVKVKSGAYEDYFEKILVSTGRRPSLRGLGLEEIGVEFTDKKIPCFNQGTFQITGFPIYLVGDANDERPLLHEAADEGRIAGYNSVRDTAQCFQRRTFLGIVFTDPNIASVGKNYKTLKDENADFATGQITYEGQGRAIVKLKERGLVHIYAQQKTGALLGAELFAPGGEHLAHLLAWAISLNLNIFDVLKLPFYHPVLEEGLRTALRDLANQVEKKQPDLEVSRCQDPPAGSRV